MMISSLRPFGRSILCVVVFIVFPFLFKPCNRIQKVHRET